VSDAEVLYAKRAADILLEEHVDAAFLTGDYVTIHRAHWAPECAKAIACLSTLPDGAYAVLGNHDWGDFRPHQENSDLVESCLADVGITVLRNQSHQIRSRPGMWIIGVDDVFFNKQDLAAALCAVPENVFKILLAHEPDYADIVPPGFALQCSGHTHGGQIRIPGLRPPYLPKLGKKYYEGLNMARYHAVYTTRGVGRVGERLWCSAEVTIITLERDASAST
jgi:predicted MPP superfamily phosphohydrolase